MAENVLGTLFQNIADAIRSKTGDSASMKPSEFPEKITAIETGGGSSADVCYVTFMNGETVLYKKAVAVGDDCADVLSRGLIETPTKESTIQYDYTFSGWALSDGGTVSSSALSSVTEDRTVYAAFTSSARYYTARFFDGDTVMQTSQVAYGSYAVPPDTYKDGYAFEGWTPSDLLITGDTDFLGTWVVDEGWIVELESPTDVNSDYSYARACVFSPDGNTLFAAWNETVYMYDATTQPYELLSSVNFGYEVSDIAINPAGTKLAVCSVEGGSDISISISIYTVTASGLTYASTFTRPSGYSSTQYLSISRCTFSHDGTKLAAAGQTSLSGKVWIYEVSDNARWTELATITVGKAANALYTGLTFSLDDTILVCASNSKLITVLDATNEWADVTDSYITTTDRPVSDVVYNPNGEQLVLGRAFSSSSLVAGITVYDTTTLPYATEKTINEARTATAQITRAAFNHDGSLLACTAYDSPYINFYDSESLTQLESPKSVPSTKVTKIAFNPDGTRFVGIGTGYMIVYEIKQ